MPGIIINAVVLRGVDLFSPRVNDPDFYPICFPRFLTLYGCTNSFFPERFAFGDLGSWAFPLSFCLGF